MDNHVVDPRWLYFDVTVLTGAGGNKHGLCKQFTGLTSMVAVAITTLFVLAMLVGIPIAAVLGIVAFAAAVLWLHLPAIGVEQQVFMQADNFGLLAVPYFIVAGLIMSRGGVSRRLVRVAVALVGAFPGGLGLATVATSAFFAGITGSGVADTAAIGSVSIAPMIRQGYKPSFAAALQASAGTLGPLIPPSLNAIFLGIVTNQSIGKLLLAILLPGLLLALLLMLVTWFLSLRMGYGSIAKFQFGELIASMKDAALALFMPVLILGSIYSGIFTATEAAALSALYGLVISTVFYRELHFRNLPRIMMEAATLSAMVMFLIATATAFSWTMTVGNVTQSIVNMITQLPLGHSPFLMLTVLAIFMLLGGAILDQSAAVIVLPPLIFPIGLNAGIAPMHLGAVLITALAIGLVLPPIGFTVIVAAAISKQPVAAIYRDCVPFFIVLFIGMMLVIAIPSLDDSACPHVAMSPLVH